jgi:hypothetical protein
MFHILPAPEDLYGYRIFFEVFADLTLFYLVVEAIHPPISRFT